MKPSKLMRFYNASIHIRNVISDTGPWTMSKIINYQQNKCIIFRWRLHGILWGLGTKLMTPWDEITVRPNNVPLSSLSIFSIKTQKRWIPLFCLNYLSPFWYITGVELPIGFLVWKKLWPYERRNQVCRKEMWGLLCCIEYSHSLPSPCRVVRHSRPCWQPFGGSQSSLVKTSPK